MVEVVGFFFGLEKRLLGVKEPWVNDGCQIRSLMLAGVSIRDQTQHLYIPP